MDHIYTNTVELAPIFLTPAEVSTILSVSKNQLRQMRRSNSGPAFFDLGNSLVRYSTADVHRWSVSGPAQSLGKCSQTSSL